MKSLLITSIILFSCSVVVAQTSDQEPESKKGYFDLNFNYSMPLNAFKSQDPGFDNAGYALHGIGGMIGYTSNFKNSNLGWYTALGYFRNEQQHFLGGKMADSGDSLLLSNVFHQTYTFMTGPTYRYDTGPHVFYARFNFAAAFAGLSRATFDTSNLPNTGSETEYSFKRELVPGYSIELGFIVNQQLSLGIQMLHLGSVEHNYLIRRGNNPLPLPADSNAIQMLNLKIGWVFMHHK